MTQDVLTTEQLAARWGLAPGTLENWRVLGIGPRFVRLHKGRRAPVVYRIADVLEYERKNLAPIGGTR